MRFDRKVSCIDNERMSYGCRGVVDGWREFLWCMRVRNYGVLAVGDY